MILIEEAGRGVGYLVLARIIEPTSKLDTIRVLEEVGIAPASYPTINRRLPVYAKAAWRAKLAKP